MIRLNGVEYEYSPGLSLGELVEYHNRNHSRLRFEGCVTVVDGAALDAARAPGWALEGDETIFIVPKLDGG